MNAFVLDRVGAQPGEVQGHPAAVGGGRASRWLAAATLCLLGWNSLWAQSPGADSWNPAADEPVYSALVQRDGKIVLGGEFASLDGVNLNNLARVNADGTPDNGFAPQPNGSVYTLALQTDGKILVGGNFTFIGGKPRLHLARLNGDGTLDDGFNPGSNDDVTCLAMQADGKIVVGGGFGEVAGQTRGFLARWNANGTPDNGFPLGADNWVQSIAVQADGKIVVVGEFTLLGGKAHSRIARLNQDGTSDADFHSYATGSAYAVAIQPDGKIVVGGDFTDVDDQNRNYVARLNADGNLDQGFSPDADWMVVTLALQADGKILIGGLFSTMGGQPRDNVARVNADGTLDAGFDPAPDGEVDLIAVQPDGKILLGGYFNVLGGEFRTHLGRLNATAPATQTLSATPATVTWTRGGSSPEISRASFERSTDQVHWAPLGVGTKTPGGWQLLNLSLLPGNSVRARGMVSGDIVGSSWFVESVAVVAGPQIILHPRSQSVVLGQAAVFSGDALSPSPLTYQWTFNGLDIPGATADTLTIPVATLLNAGDYRLRISDASGSVLSGVATLGILISPVLLQQPSSVAVPLDAPAVFCAQASGTAPLRYQWRLNGVNLEGANQPCYTVDQVQLRDGGRYSVVASGPGGSVASDPASLNITELPNTPPAADRFADRFELFGKSGVLSVNNLGATKEPGEPDHAGKPGGSSVWYTWQAPVKGIAMFRTTGSSFDTLLAIYSGESLGKLGLVQSDEDRGGYLASEAHFNAQAGAFYQVAIDGYARGQGSFILSWNLEATSEELPVITSQPRSLTVPGGSPAILSVTAIGPNLSYQWTLNGSELKGATSPSVILKSVERTDVGTYTVRVTTGRSRSALSLPALLEIGTVNVQATDKLEDLFFPPAVLRSGEVMMMAAATVNGPIFVTAGTIGPQLLNNSESANAGPLEATLPCGLLLAGGNRVWYDLVGLDDGVFTLDTTGSDIDTLLGVVTSDFSSLTAVACDDDGASDGKRSLVRFKAVARTHYLIGVDGKDGAKGAIMLNWSLGAPLTARRHGGNLELSWLASLAGYGVEAASALKSPPVWSPVTVPLPVTVDGTNILSLPAPAVNQFYRLRHP